jgi:hypothetical protein
MEWGLHPTGLPSRALAAVSAASVHPGTAAPRAHAAATCDGYANQRDAQNTADTRDPDGDGIYCESLPCPCAGRRARGWRAARSP